MRVDLTSTAPGDSISRVECRYDTHGRPTIVQKTIRRALVIAAIYLAGSYLLDRPEEAKQDVVALRELAAELPEPGAVAESVQETGEIAGQTIFDAKQRLDSVRGKVQNSIALGTERFAGSD